MTWVLDSQNELVEQIEDLELEFVCRCAASLKAVAWENEIG